MDTTLSTPSERQTTHYFLFYYNEDITQFIHPQITPIKLSETDKVYFEYRGFSQIKSVPDVDNIGFLSPSFFKKSGISTVDAICDIQLDERTVCGFYTLH